MCSYSLCCLAVWSAHHFLVSFLPINLFKLCHVFVLHCAAIPGDGWKCQEVYSTSVWSTREGLVCATDGSRAASPPLCFLLDPHQCPGPVHLAPRLPHQTSSHSYTLSQTETSLNGRPTPSLPFLFHPSLSFLLPFPSRFNFLFFN